MPFFQNIVINLKAAGPSAVLVAWLLSITAIAVFADSDLGSKALSIVGMFGFAFIGILGAAGFSERK